MEGESRKHRKDLYIEKLHLAPLSTEGGYLCETYHNNKKVATAELKGGERILQNAIYYMIAQDETPIGGRNYFNRNQSPIIHFFHDGWPMKYTTISKEGVIKEHLLGCDVENGQVPQLLVPPNHWKSGEILHDEKYAKFPGEIPFSLISEAVAPGWDIKDLEIATHESLKEEFPQFYEKVQHMIIPASYMSWTLPSSCQQESSG